jgi:iron complex outermembrane receptor protein
MKKILINNFIFAAVAIAATSGANGAENTDKTIAKNAMEVIVVTAQKRQQGLQEVSISVSVANEEEIRDRRIDSVTDIGLFTANANVKEAVPGLMPIITVRGVGLNDFNAANNPATGVYIDEVSLSSLALLSSDFFDLERMEVLKGPQGTMYGRNSTAGALNIVTAKPDLEYFSARVSGTTGSYDTYDVDGMVNVPLSDSLGVRFAVKGIDQGEGYWTNGTTGNNFGQRDVKMARAQMLWLPTDRTRVLLKLEKQQARSELGSAEFFGAVPTATTSDCPGQPACANFLGYSDTDNDPFRGNWSTSPDYNLNQFNSALKVDVDFDFATLTSVTGAIDFDRGYSTDVDASPAKILDFDNTDDVKQFSQEVRLAGDKNSVFWQVGVFYARDEVKTTYSGQLQSLLNTTTFTAADQESTSKALFVNAEWPLNSQLTLITGLRASKENKSIIGATSDLVTEAPASFLSFTPQGLGPVVVASVNDSIDDTSVDWKLGLNWTLEDETLVYVSASQGTKSGGFFTGVATSNQQLIPYDSETLTAYEIGIKGRAETYGLSYEASSFYYDYKDIQTYISDQSGAVPVNRLSNIDGATIYGLDLQARWNSTVIEGLSVIAGAGLLNSELEAFGSAGGLIAKGNEQPEAPKISGNMQISYAFNVTQDYSAKISVDGNYQSKVEHNAVNDPLTGSDGYSVYNTRLMVYFPNDLELSVWGKNLAGKEYVTNAGNQLALGNGFRVYGSPRTWGMTLTKFFD